MPESLMKTKEKYKISVDYTYLIDLMFVNLWTVLAEF